MEEDALKSYREAGKAAKGLLNWASKLIKPGVKYLEVADKTEERALSEGLGLAFPVNVSVNEIAAHYGPKHADKLEFTEEDVVKLDLGVHVDGYIADTALSVDLTGEYGKMLEANQQALDEAINVVKAGVSVKEIGAAVQSTLQDAGYKPIENLTGHELKQYDLHAGLAIPNIKVPYDWKLKEGMALAFEPFATDGAGHVIESKSAEIYSVVEEKKTRMREARNLLKELSDRRGLPFVARWYSKKMNPMKLNLVLNQMTREDILKAYPPLHDRGKGMVSQFEHTLIVTEDGCEVTTG